MPNPNMFFRVTHTGLYGDGRHNSGPVYISDLDTGMEFQHRKVAVYVPAGGFIDIPASSRSMLSFQTGVIHKLVQAGIVTARWFIQPESFDNSDRPDPMLYPVGTMIFNTDDQAPNFSDGTNWRTADGTIT